MSTLNTTNIKNPASSSNNIVLGADGSTTLQLSSLNGGPLAGTRNRIINGDMRIAQRGTSFAAIGANTYSLDRWAWNQVGAMVCTVSQSTDVPNDTFQSSYKVDVTTADTSIAAGDLAVITQRIEGYNVRDLIGTTFTLSFWVKSPKAGVHCITLANGLADRSYAKEYTITTTNTWEYKTITVSGGLITSGTWDWTNGLGLRLRFTLAAGTTFHTTADAWQTGDFFATANQVNVMDNTSNDFFLTGVQLEPGPVATPFEQRPIGTELALCQRYYEKSYPIASAPGSVTTLGRWESVSFNASEFYDFGRLKFTTRKRATPTMSLYSTSGTGGAFFNISTGVNQGNSRASNISDTGAHLDCSNAAMTTDNAFGTHWVASAEL